MGTRTVEGLYYIFIETKNNSDEPVRIVSCKHLFNQKMYDGNDESAQFRAPFFFV